jgi:hypothetical protein
VILYRFGSNALRPADEEFNGQGGLSHMFTGIYLEAFPLAMVLRGVTLSRCPLLVEFALETLKIALNGWNSTFLLPLITGIWCY